MFRTVFSFVFLFALIFEAIYCQNNCPTAPASPADRRTDKTKLRMCSFNAEWLFLTRNTPWHPDNVEKHVINIAGVMASVDADIWVIPETEDCIVLNYMMANTVLKSSPLKPYLVRGTDTATGQNVGVLSKIDPTTNFLRTEERVAFPVPGNTCKYNGVETGTHGVSKHFYARFDVQGLKKPLMLMGVHFLAFPTTADRCIKREGQASVMRILIDREGLQKGYEVCVAGDFNDYDPNVVDAAGSVPTSRVMSIMKGAELKNVLTGFTPTSEVYSAWYDRNSNCIDDGGLEHTLIDHIICTSGLRPRRVWFDRSYKASCTSIMSDHWPLCVDFYTTDTLADSFNTTFNNNNNNNAANTPVANSTPVTQTKEEVKEESGSIMFILLGAGAAFVLLFIGLIIFTIYKTRKSRSKNDVENLN